MSETPAYCYAYPRPGVTVDIVCCRYIAGQLQCVLIKRSSPPYAQCWALPGGYVEIDEELEAAARRELYEETHLTPHFIQQFHTFGGVHRDPRGRTISVAYLALVDANSQDSEGKAGSDAAEVTWMEYSALPDALAFDHALVARTALIALGQWQQLGIWPGSGDIKDI